MNKEEDTQKEEAEFNAESMARVLCSALGGQLVQQWQYNRAQCKSQLKTMRHIDSSGREMVREV